MTVSFQKVIIVEEDPVEAEILEFYLDRAGVEAVTVRTTEEALRHVDPSTPYGVLTEASGEEIDWLALAKATLGYPSIFMVLSDEPLSREDDFDAMRHGVCEVFIKPVEPKAVVERLRFSQPVPLGSGSVGVPPEGFGGDLRTHHAQKLLQFSRRHCTNALIEIEMGAQFGGILVKDGQPIDAWIEGFRGRSALNAILMLEEAPFVYFGLAEGAEELNRPNVIGPDNSSRAPEWDEPDIPESRSVSPYDAPALSPQSPPPIPAAPAKKKKRRRFSKTGGTLRQSQVSQQSKKPMFADTMVDETSLDDLQITPARNRKEVIALSPNDTLVSAPPPVPPAAPTTTPEPPAGPPPLRSRRNTSEAVATATIAHAEYTETEDKDDVLIPILESEKDFFREDSMLDDEFSQELSEWENELQTGQPWHQNPTLSKVLLGILLLLVAFIGWRLVISYDTASEEATTEQEEVAAASQMTGLQLWAKGDVDEAHAKLSAEFKEAPTDIDALTGLALVAYERQEFEVSRKHFLALLEADASLKRAHWYLGTIAKKKGQKDEMKFHWNAFMQHYPNGKHADALGPELE